MKTTRKRYSAEFKARVALDAIRGDLTLAELATKHGVHHTMIASWKRQLPLQGFRRQQHNQKGCVRQVLQIGDHGSVHAAWRSSGFLSVDRCAVTGGTDIAGEWSVGVFGRSDGLFRPQDWEARLDWDFTAEQLEFQQRVRNASWRWRPRSRHEARNPGAGRGRLKVSRAGGAG